MFIRSSPSFHPILSRSLFSLEFTVYGTVVNEWSVGSGFLSLWLWRWLCLTDKVRGVECDGVDQLCAVSADSLFQKASSCVGTSVCSSLYCTRRGVGEGSGAWDEVTRVGRGRHRFRGRGYSRYSFLPWLASFPLRKASCTSPCSSKPLASWVR